MHMWDVLPAIDVVFLAIQFWDLHSSDTQDSPVLDQFISTYRSCSLPNLAFDWRVKWKQQTDELLSPCLCSLFLSACPLNMITAAKLNWLVLLLLPFPVWALVYRNCLRLINSQIQGLALFVFQKHIWWCITEHRMCSCFGFYICLEFIYTVVLPVTLWGLFE